MLPSLCGERGSARVRLVVGTVVTGQMCTQSTFILPILYRPAYYEYKLGLHLRKARPAISM
jgi:hypothetical protein